MATLDFKGKALVQNYHLSVKYHELVPKRDRSLTDKVRLDDNLIIHGDNLKALKALLPTYAGRVKCIYIDPPYNTGNEGWAYNDNVNSPMLQEWLGKAVDREDLTRHDKWLCMIMPRLKLLRELLRDDGAIFISIDDNESSHLRLVMDEIFGESCFIAELIWKSRQHLDSRSKTGISLDHEYVLVYSRIPGGVTFKGKARDTTKYTNPDNDSRGPWMSRSILGLATAEQRPNLHYELTDPKTGRKYPCAKSTGWRYSKDTMAKLVAEGRILFPKKEGGRPREKLFEANLQTASTGFPSIIDGVFTDEGTLSIREILGGQVFSFPKSPSLVQSLVQQVAIEPDAIVLDSFGGSGTTAHAVLALNKEDGGNRKFILVECEDYADTITAERVRRVIQGVKGASDENLKRGLGGTFSYFELGKAIELDSILDGKNLPSYLELARYVFYTATGEEFDERKVNEKRSFVGESKTHEVYLFYQPDLDYLKKTALTLERAEGLGKLKDKRRLVFAPTKYLDQEQLDALRIDFAQLPFEIYKLAQ